VHGIVVNDSCIQQTVEYMGNNSRAAGVLMAQGGGLTHHISASGAINIANDSQTHKKSKHFKIIDKIAKKLDISNDIRDMGHVYHEMASNKKIQNKKKKFESLTKAVLAS
jgi:hypothetical protein